MDVRTLDIDFRELGYPLGTQIMAWVKKNRVSLPLLLTQSGVSLSPEEYRTLNSQKQNAISAMPAPYHPYLFALRDRDSGEVSFPFRENVGEGRRRQDLDPILLIVPRFALVYDLRTPFKPILISGTAPTSFFSDPSHEASS